MKRQSRGVFDEIDSDAEREWKRQIEDRERIEYGFPKSCLCRGQIIDDAMGKEETTDTLPGKRLFQCQYYEDNGMHTRKPWVNGVHEEIERLIGCADEAESLIWAVRKYNIDMTKLKEEVQELKNKVSVLEKLCFTEAP